MAVEMAQDSHPPHGVSEGGGMVERMYGADDTAKSQWFTAFVSAAHLAGDDLERCAAVVLQLRIVGDLLDAPQLLKQPEQGGFVGVGEIPVSQDQLLNRGFLTDADGDPAQVA